MGAINALKKNRITTAKQNKNKLKVFIFSTFVLLSYNYAGMMYVFSSCKNDNKCEFKALTPKEAKRQNVVYFYPIPFIPW